MTSNDYQTYGVSLNPSTPVFGEKVKLVYNGLLAEKGAIELFAHVGFGNNWSSVYDFRMNKTTGGFEATIPVTSQDSLNLCFKDSAGNWDNNSGSNYSFPVVD